MSEQTNPELRPEDKLEAGQLTEASPALRKLDNFWYHYKWTVIVVIFFVSVAIICLVQLFSRPEYDSSIVIATHYRMNSEEYDDFEELIARICPEDFNGDGEKKLNIVLYQFYSEKEIAEAEAEYAAQEIGPDGETDRFQINGAYNKSEYDGFNRYTMTGETSVYIISPALYERLTDGEDSSKYRLMPLSELYPDGKLPKGARPDGYGIDLKETDFYKYSPAAQVIPDTAILCLHRPTVSGKSSDAAAYEEEKAFFMAIADYEVAE